VDAGPPPLLVSRGLLIAVGLAAVLVAALGLRAFASVVAPVFLALVLSITVQPLRRLPARHGLPAWLGTVLSLVAVYLIVLGLIVILVLSGVQLAGLLEDYAPQFQASLQSLGASLEAAGVSQGQLEAVESALDPGQLIGVVAALLGGVAGILGSIAFLVLLLFFTVTDAATFAANLARVSPAGRRLAEAFQLFARGSRQYLAVATIFGAGVALCDVVALVILDIRYAWLWGLLAFVTSLFVKAVFIDVDPERRWLTPLLSSASATEPAADRVPRRRARAAGPEAGRDAAPEPDGPPQGPG
jgi:predicted PurR-regulated permease PerM